MANSISKADMIISPIRVRPGKGISGPNSAQSNNQFNKILQSEVKKQETLRFSAHAEKRLQSRNINLNQNQKMKLDQAVETAARKGIKDSLILLNNLAFVVNIKNRTVVTAMEQNQLKEGAVTNIDGAMILFDGDS